MSSVYELVRPCARRTKPDRHCRRHAAPERLVESCKYRSADDAGKSSSRGSSVVAKYVNPRGLRILQALDDVASSHKATPAQVAIAWLIARPGITAPIVSATSVAQLHDVLGLLDLQPAGVVLVLAQDRRAGIADRVGDQPLL